MGFNVLAGFTPLGEGSTIMDLEDFIVSNNLLPLGSLGYVLFCTKKIAGDGTVKLKRSTREKDGSFRQESRDICLMDYRF